MNAVERLVKKPVFAGDYQAEYQLGQIVRLSYMPFDESPIGAITGIIVVPSGFIYAVTWADSHVEARHCDLELQLAD